MVTFGSDSGFGVRPQKKQAIRQISTAFRVNDLRVLLLSVLLLSGSWLGSSLGTTRVVSLNPSLKLPFAILLASNSSTDEKINIILM